MTKFVYSFNEGSKDMKSLLGGKGANLAEMTTIGLPVPFGFTITTQACGRYYEEEGSVAADIEEAIYEKIEELENVTGKGFGQAENPLLVSVRSLCKKRSSTVSLPLTFCTHQIFRSTEDIVADNFRFVSIPPFQKILFQPLFFKGQIYNMHKKIALFNQNGKKSEK